MTDCASIQKSYDLHAQLLVPNVHNEMVENRTQLLPAGIGLRSAVQGPRLAGAVEQRGRRRKARVIRASLFHGNSVDIGDVGSCAGRDVTAKAKRREARRRGGGQGDDRVLFKRLASLLVVPSKRKFERMRQRGSLNEERK